MNKMNNMFDSRKSIRWQLLATVSAAALFASAYGAEAVDNEADRPLLWIELGGQLDRLSSPQEAYSPPFMASITQANLLSALNVQRPPAYAIDEDAKILFQPDNSDWVFSASIQYGRSAANRHHHQTIANKTVPVSFNFNPPYSALHVGPKYYYPASHAKFADGQANRSEIHTILDFQAGKDVGLGLFGNRGSSVVSAGVRIAQFTSRSNVTLHAEPDVQYPTAPAPIHSKYDWLAFRYNNPPIRFHDYAGMLDSQRSFRGLGPSLSWNASMPFAGDTGHGELSVDWGVNGAVLFGRQRASGNHKTAVHNYTKTAWQTYASLHGNNHLLPGRFVNGPSGLYTCHGEHLDTAIAPAACHTNATGFNRARTVTVPNLGGFAGLSYRIEDFKVALGYRADFFFGAIDGGIDTRKEESRGFFGPFASISVGVGD
jgi:iron complex outermembrane receptor protein